MLTAPVDLAALVAPLALTTHYWQATLITAGLAMSIFTAGGHYRTRRHLSILDELPSLCGRLLAATAIVAIVAALHHDSVGYVAGFLRCSAVSAGLVVLGRTITINVAMVARKRRWAEQNTLIIGSGPTATELARILRRYPQYGLRFVGHVDAERVDCTAIPLLGALENLEKLSAVVDCEVLIIADSGYPESALSELLQRKISSTCDIWAIPRLWGRSQSRIPDHIGAIPIVQIHYPRLAGPRWAIKRAVDVVFASLALVVLAPVLALCALATWLEGGRGILFHQERIGQHGRPFKVVKFRSMHPTNEHESQTRWSIAHDGRVGPVGRFLRRTSLDELPQLWNILRGDMTLVGPRPERPYFVEKFSVEHPHYAARHRVPVGLTGLAQVSGLRGDTPISDRARFDNYYVENWSLWLDLKVLLRTVSEIFRASGR